MTVRMSIAEARKRGYLSGDIKVKAAKVRSRKTARGRYWTQCTTCELEFHTIKAEDDHVRETGHARYEMKMEDTDG